MDTLDGLDAAFKKMLSSTSQNETTGDVDDFGLHGVAELTAALAAENQVAVTALVAIVDEAPKPFLCGALCGAARYVSKVTKDTGQREALAKLEALVLTRKGLLKRLLRDPEVAELKATATVFSSEPSNREREDMRAYIQLLTNLPVMEPEDVLRLFEAGLWCADRVRQSRITEGAQLTGLSESKIAALKATVNEALS